MKSAKEDTGFVKGEAEKIPRDLVAVEMTSNTGIAIIEEGYLNPSQLVLQVTHKVVLDRADQSFVIVSAF